jgi:phenylacetate-CoA ligase
VPHGWVPAHPDELERLPVVTKEDLLAAQAVHPPWGDNLCVDERAVAQVHLTSGTSGIGQERYAASAADVAVMGESWRPQYTAIGLVPGDVAVLTIPIAFFCAGLSAFEGARRCGLVPLATGVASKPMILDLIAQHRAAYLYGTESLLMQLAHLARGRDHDWAAHLKGVQAVGSSTPLLDAVREVFGVPVHEVYGCTQAAAKIATTCARGVAGGTAHFHAEHLYIETRDPASGAWRDAGEAEIILSTTYREASPVFRFAMRDAVTLVPAGACACGDARRGYVPGSLKRLDAMAKVRGVNVWPQGLERVLLAHAAVRDYRASVSRRADGADELLIRVAPRAGVAAGPVLAEELEALVRRQTLVRPRIEFDAAIEETDGQYKVRRFADLRAA